MKNKAGHGYLDLIIGYYNNLMRALDKLKEATEFLKRYGIEDAGREAEIIVSHCIGINRTVLYRDNPEIREEKIERIDELLKRRSKREPLQYILGYVDFYGLKIKVGKGVLIPRPETELLAEEAIKAVKREALSVMRKEKNTELPLNSSLVTRHSSLIILDLCTGSGCLALALAREFPDAKVYGTDTSENAIRYAKENAELNCINNVTFLEGNLFDPIAELIARHPSPVNFDIIVSNPPYIRRDDIKNLQLEIKNWEPVEALDGGKDGLDYYRAIIPEAKGYLKREGFLIFEIGAGQSEEVSKIAKDTGFGNISLIKDYAGIERIFVAKI
jgi:release factor glutamine methyltransferase